MMTPNPKRKKWTESEEKTLIDKYGEMIADGSLAKMKTREKKYRPIASHVNSVHHIRDPIAFPWHWTWKDVSTKVQNMRHQYLLVKQKVKKSSDIISPLVDNNSAAAAAATSDIISNVDEFDWVEGLTHWSNFLRYKDIFGDVPVSFSNNSNNNSNNGSDLMLLSNEDRENASFIGAARGTEIAEFGQMGQSGGNGDFAGIENENGGLGSGFEYEGEQGGENYNGNYRMVDDGFAYEEVEPNGHHNLNKKRKVLRGLEKRAFGFLVNQMGQLRELEARLEQREVERQRERQKREQQRMEIEKEWERKLEERERNKEEKEKGREKLSRHRLAEWEAMDKESEERETRRKEEELIQEREWEERMNRTRSDWKKRIDEMLSQHRAEMGQIQSCILHEQQNLTSQLLGIVSQWTGQPTGLSDHTGASSHYLSQMMQNLHHVNGMVNGDARVDGDNQEDHQFIVDG